MCVYDLPLGSDWAYNITKSESPSSNNSNNHINANNVSNNTYNDINNNANSKANNSNNANKANISNAKVNDKGHEESEVRSPARNLYIDVMNHVRGVNDESDKHNYGDDLHPHENGFNRHSRDRLHHHDPDHRRSEDDDDKVEKADNPQVSSDNEGANRTRSVRDMGIENKNRFEYTQLEPRTLTEEYHDDGDRHSAHANRATDGNGDNRSPRHSADEKRFDAARCLRMLTWATLASEDRGIGLRAVPAQHNRRWGRVSADSDCRVLTVFRHHAHNGDLHLTPANPDARDAWGHRNLQPSAEVQGVDSPWSPRQLTLATLVSGYGGFGLVKRSQWNSDVGHGSVCFKKGDLGSGGYSTHYSTRGYLYASCLFVRRVVCVASAVLYWVFFP